MVEGYRRLGDEAAAQVPGDIDALCLYVGTAGCLLGVSRSLRGRYPAMLRVAVEPAESAVLSGRPAGTHRIEGGGVGFRPDLLGPEDVDEVVPVSTADAFAMARRAARVEGLLSGPSTGANLVAALQPGPAARTGAAGADRAGRLGAEVPDRAAVHERVTRRSTWRRRPTADRDARRR